MSSLLGMLLLVFGCFFVGSALACMDLVFFVLDLFACVVAFAMFWLLVGGSWLLVACMDLVGLLLELGRALVGVVQPHNQFAALVSMRPPLSAVCSPCGTVWYCPAFTRRSSWAAARLPLGDFKIR